MSKTDENLQAAFAGESQANRRYLAFAQKADEDGFPQVAKLFRAAADAETVHALMHLRTMKGIGSTAENLATAIGGEHAEFTEMYPAFIATAKEEQNKEATLRFAWANQVEEIHHRLYKAAAAAVDKGQDRKAAAIYVCQGCGNTVEGDAPDVCSICGAPKSRFKLIE